MFGNFFNFILLALCSQIYSLRHPPCNQIYDIARPYVASILDHKSYYCRQFADSCKKEKQLATIATLLH